MRYELCTESYTRVNAVNVGSSATIDYSTVCTAYERTKDRSHYLSTSLDRASHRAPAAADHHRHPSFPVRRHSAASRVPSPRLPAGGGSRRCRSSRPTSSRSSTTERPTWRRRGRRRREDSDSDWRRNLGVVGAVVVDIVVVDIRTEYFPFVVDRTVLVVALVRLPLDCEEGILGLAAAVALIAGQWPCRALVP